VSGQAQQAFNFFGSSAAGLFSNEAAMDLSLIKGIIFCWQKILGRIQNSIKYCVS